MRGGAFAEPRPRPVSELEFAGCEPVRVSEAALLGSGWDGRRLEYWHAATETAWVVREPVSPYHEGPAARLAQLVRQICLARGSDARCFGGMDLRLRAADGTLTDIMQADQTVILHPTRVELPSPAHLVVGEHDLPDVVLEVDNTTDVRRGKLFAYQAWGFPEVWVEVPDLASPGRQRGLRPGLTIHALESGRYRKTAVSRALPGWRATEIHRALNEQLLSAETEKDLWRVGRALGKREGTAPEDDLLMRRMERRGHARGRAEAGAEARAEAAASILRARGLDAPPDRSSGAVCNASLDAVVAAALHARDETDFLTRLNDANAPAER